MEMMTVNVHRMAFTERMVTHEDQLYHLEVGEERRKASS